MYHPSECCGSCLIVSENLFSQQSLFPSSPCVESVFVLEVFALGIFTLAAGFVHNKIGLIVLRAFCCICESPCMPVGHTGLRTDIVNLLYQAQR